MLATLGAIKALFPAPFTGRLAQQWQKSCFRPSSSCFSSSLLLPLLQPQHQYKLDCGAAAAAAPTASSISSK